ncbi:MAG: BlaI/MecI/CopY family transcriptional regulator [Oscillospiraceae bacterium]|nr:BlaI/MecI/CopY family transcriptional regulator [Oscillospiraceae bacterium]
MYKLTDSEWQVLETLWQADSLLLGEVVDSLYDTTKWSRNTVHTYLTRMEKKGLVKITRDSEPHRYSRMVTRDDCSKKERENLLHKVYGGSVGDLVAAFLKESKITPEEKAKLNKLLDDMEV